MGEKPQNKNRVVLNEDKRIVSFDYSGEKSFDEKDFKVGSKFLSIMEGMIVQFYERILNVSLENPGKEIVFKWFCASEKATTSLKTTVISNGDRIEILNEETGSVTHSDLEQWFTYQENQAKNLPLIEWCAYCNFALLEGKRFNINTLKELPRDMYRISHSICPDCFLILDMVIDLNPCSPKDTPKRETHVLVVDDNLFCRRVLRQMISTAGYTVNTFESGPEILKYLDSKQEDGEISSVNIIVITDIEMPEMNGFELSACIRSKFNSTIPIIAVTGHLGETLNKLGEESGIMKIFQKPVKKLELFPYLKEISETFKSPVPNLGL